MPNALRVVLATLIVLCCVPARFDGATVTAPDKGSVRVGLLDTHSGYYEPEGEDVDAGFRYFLATHDGELGGFRVELRTADENEYGALASARQLVQVDMVDAIVGLVRSSDALLVASYLAERKTPLVIAGAGADALTQSEAQKNFIRVAPHEFARRHAARSRSGPCPARFCQGGMGRSRDVRVASANTKLTNG